MRAVRPAVAALIAAALAVTSCSVTSPRDGVTVHSFGDDGTGFARHMENVSGLIIWFHGLDSTGTEVVDSPKQPRFASTFLKDGWAIATALAGGNAFGNPESQQEYRDLIASARAFYRPERTVFIAESMGALTALLLYAEPRFRDITGMVGISPLMGVPPERRTLSIVTNAWDGPFPPSYDPMSWPSERLSGRRFQLFHSPEDTTIPRDASADAFARRYDASTPVTMETCSGAHVDPSCYREDLVRRWIDAS